MPIIFRSATPSDYGEIFTLQRAAFVDEARLYDTPDVPALNESFVELTERLTNSTSWVAVEQSRIIAAVSLRAYRDVPDVERLMVAPDRRGEGISARLLEALERGAIDAGYDSLQLIVGDLAVDNQQIYHHLGWRRTNTFRLSGFDDVILHNMTKVLVPVD